MSEIGTREDGLRSIPWQISYRTSRSGPGGEPVNILHDFYIPALARSVSYDRVAGYFRSTSLAAASQGFSAFVGQGGRMRLIVGADLDLEDVEAVLNGTEERLAAALNPQIDKPHTWPEQVRRGVELLAWMVAKGFLEVRVAFRVHGESGEPLRLSAVDDGYVHMKWALFSDSQGNRVYISGSLNESRRSLTLNAENIDVHCDWRGEIERRRADEAEREFQALWDDQNPCVRVLTLPEAVRQRLIRIAQGITRPLEIDGASAAPLEVPPPSAMERLRFALLCDGPRLPGGRYVGMETAPITPWPHQAVVARRLIETWPASYLLCDEVGLGKTIEAGLAIRSLYLSGLVKRVLISPPASLTRQWHREMAFKFYLPFGRALTGANIRHEYLLPLDEEHQANSIYEPNLTIVSTGLLSRKDRSRELGGAKGFDIALVDEAHYARRKNPTQGTRGHPQYGNLYRTIRDRLLPKSRSLFLATATPMQLDPVEAADLLRFTMRAGAYQFDPSLTRFYYEILGRMVGGEEIDSHEWSMLRKSVDTVRDQDPLFWQFVNRAVIDGRTRLAIRQWLERGMIPRRSDFRGVRRLIFGVSPLSRVMLRHTRSLLEIYHEEGKLSSTLPERKILPVRGIVFNNREREAYDQLEAYCQGLTEQMKRVKGAKRRAAVGFLLSFLRLRFASSLFAIRETVRRRLERVEATMQMLGNGETEESEDFDPEDILDEGDDDTEVVRTFLKDREPEDLQWEKEKLQSMLSTLSDLSGQPSKMTQVFKLLSGRRIQGTGRLQQTVIFTRFYDTLTDIVKRLLRADPKMLIGTYSGRGGQYLDTRTSRLMGMERDKVKQRFLRKEIDVLVCTDAAAEGLNLQTADFLVNFDLPWNPMRVEQRIGRVDRIGQEHKTIYVLNLCYVDSAEQIVYGRLLKRLRDAMAVVGTQQISLLPVTREEFQQLAEKTLNESQLEERAMERTRQARKRTVSMEIPPRDLYAMYLRLGEQTKERVIPMDLKTIWDTLINSRYLRDLGCSVTADAGDDVMRLSGIPDLVDGTALTASRTLYEQGIPELKGQLHFATYGNYVFESILAHLGEFPLPGCIRRLEVQIPDFSAALVGYAVARINDEGISDTRLVTSPHDLRDLRIDENRVLSDSDIVPLRRALKETIRKEFDAARSVDRLERLNQEAGRSQILLDLFVAKDLLHGVQIGEGSDQFFWRMIPRIEENCRDREMIRARIPIDYARRLSGLLFGLTLPTTGEYAYVDAPQPLLMTAIEAACRLASGMKVKRAELTVKAFLARLEREIEKWVH